MKRNYLILSVILIAVLALTLSGCGRDEQSLEGLCITTFELEGGTLETPTSSVSTKINFAYQPGTYVLDPTVLNGYKLTRIGYVFTGWYTDKNCTESSKWSFDTLINQEQLTLYAGWKKAIQLTYTLYYVDDNGQTVSVGKYEVSGGEKFDDWRNFAKNRAGYTPLGYYSDSACTTPWDASFTHPGMDEDLDVPVYVNYMKGTWTFVDSLDTLKKALSSGENVYLTADVDCSGETLTFSNYSGEFNGNGFTVSNFTVSKSGSAIVSCSIFNNLGNGAVIRDVSFTDVTYDLTGISASAKKVKVAALALSAGNATLSGVSVQGTVVTNYTGELPEANTLVYETNDGAVLNIDDNCVVNVTIVNN